MKTSLVAAFAALVLTAALARPAGAQGDGSKTLDQGRLITYRGDVPIATERFVYLLQGDSIVVSSGARRRTRQADGTEKLFAKNMVLCARAEDFGLLNYTSNEMYDGHTVTRSILPSDTSLTTYTETDNAAGGADLLDRPPGLVFAMDPGLFTLFDVVGRNLQHRIYGSRPVALVVFADRARNVQATATLVGPDTVVWGGRRVVTDRIALRDSSGSFMLWLSPEGHMLRLESEDGQTVVMREPPAVVPSPKRRRPPPRGK